MASFIQPLDLEKLLINTFAGSVEIFVFLSILIITAGAAFYRMPDRIFMVMVALFVVLLSPYMGGIYLITLLLTSLATFYAIARIVK